MERPQGRVQFQIFIGVKKVGKKQKKIIVKKQNKHIKYQKEDGFKEIKIHRLS